MLKVVVLNWRDYLGMGAEYVSRMRRMVDKHLTIPYEFVQVTERDITSDKEGWFCKLDLLEMFDGQVLYLDLDLHISGSIDHLVELARTAPTKIWSRNDFSYPVTLNSKVSGAGYAGPMMNNGREQTINSSVMYWRGRKDMSGAEQLIATTHGDQGIITQLFWPEGIRLFPDDWIDSYKYHRMRGLGSAPITCFHGRPKPHEVAGCMM
jgi:hypothetical protein